LFKKLLGIDYTIGPDTINGHKTKLTDTLVMSRVLNPDRVLPEGCAEQIYDHINKKNTMIGPHGLKAWSFRVAGTKPTVEDWRNQPIDTYIHRCIEDVKVNVKVLEELEKEKGQHDWTFALKLAHSAYHLMCKQETAGVYFDTEKAVKLVDTIDGMMEEIANEVEWQLPPMKITESNLKYPPKKQFKQDGSPSALAERYFGELEEKGGVWVAVEHGIELPHHVPLVTEQPMRMSNQGPLKEWLMTQGWEPTLWNYKKVTKNDSMDASGPYYKQKVGDFAKDKSKPKNKQRVKTTPKIQEQGQLCPNLESMQGDLAKLVVKWLSLRNRRSVIKSPKKETGWLYNPRLEVDNRLSAYSTGLTNTRRQKHGGVANIPKAKASVLLGKEMRDLFRAAPGKVLVGYDASALEGRCEAHFTYPYDNGKYAKEILEGDIHTKNAVAFGLITQAEADRAQEVKNDEERSVGDQEVFDKWEGARDGGGSWGGGAKSGKYCVTYGGGPPKLAATLNLPEKKGKKLYDAFWKSNKSLTKLKDDLVDEWKQSKKKRKYKDAWGNTVGFITGIDGGRVIIRKEHSVINAQFQNCGAMIMDLAGVFMDKWVTKRGIDAQRVVYYHDEYVWECNKRDAEIIGQLGVKSIIEAGKYLGLNIPLDAEFKVGQTWGDVH
jgi:hypothetical protein